jgi:hypothetical protein
MPLSVPDELLIGARLPANPDGAEIVRASQDQPTIANMLPADGFDAPTQRPVQEMARPGHAVRALSFETPGPLSAPLLDMPVKLEFEPPRVPREAAALGSSANELQDTHAASDIMIEAPRPITAAMGRLGKAKISQKKAGKSDRIAPLALPIAPPEIARAGNSAPSAGDPMPSGRIAQMVERSSRERAALDLPAGASASEAVPALGSFASLAAVFLPTNGEVARSVRPMSDVDTNQPLSANGASERDEAEPALVATLKQGSIADRDMMLGSAERLIDIKSSLVTRVDGKAVGRTRFRQTATSFSIHVDSLLGAIADVASESDLARAASSLGDAEYASVADLKKAGLAISYDPVYDEISMGSTDYRPRAAHKVQIDQIDPAAASASYMADPVMIEQISR